MSLGSGNGWLAVIGAIGGSMITGLVGLLLWVLNHRKFDAEVDKLEAETNDLTNARFIRELDHLSMVNQSQGVQIDRLRVEIIEYAKRETKHVIEIESLKIQIDELKRNHAPAVAGMDLSDIFPVDIPHTPSEFDAGETPKQPDEPPA